MLRGLIGAGRTVAVTGHAGVGKSTLALAALAGIPHLHGGGLATLADRPFFAIERALRHSVVGTHDEVADELVRAVDGALLLIDDLHWVDAHTLAVLQVVQAQLAIVVVARTGAPALNSLQLHHTIALAPLGRAQASTLARRLHPHLDPSSLVRLLDVAEGNPLLLEMLVSEGASSPTLRAALSPRLKHLSLDARDGLTKLALLGRPAPATLLGFDPSVLDSLLSVVDDEVAFRHPLISDAVNELSDEATRRRLHGDLARVLNDDIEVARHLLHSADPAAARDRAERALAGSVDLAQRSALFELVAVATSVLGEPADDAWVRAAEGFVDAGHLDAALDAAARVPTSSLMWAEALLQRGRARWFAGDVEQAELDLSAAVEAAVDDELRARVLVEHTYLVVRDRRAGSLQLAENAASVADGSPHERRALACLGAALLYAGRPGWDELLTRVVDAASSAGDLDVMFTAAFHLTSGLGFVGRLEESVAAATEMVELAQATGRRTWADHFFSALLFTRAQLGQAPAWIVDEGRRFVEQHPIFRNTFQVEHAVVISLVQLGQRQAADQQLARFEAAATGADAVAVLAATAADLAWLDRDMSAMQEAVECGRRVGDAYFGIRLAVEAAAASLAFEVGVPFEIDLPSSSLPMLWPALHELTAIEHALRGDPARAQAELHLARRHWCGQQPRFEVRSLHTAALVARRFHEREAHSFERLAVEVAREHRMIGLLRRLGAAADPRLTPREEDVLLAVGEGCTSQQAAAMLGVSPSTIDDHVESARRKLGASTRREAVFIASSSVGERPMAVPS